MDLLLSLWRVNFRAHHSNLKISLLTGFVMFAQNLMFFMMWIVFFGAIRQVKGWQLTDVGLMLGIITAAAGCAMFVADGVRTIGYKIADGSIDAFLVRPCHALPALLLSRSQASGLGDILSGPFYWFVFGGAQLSDLPFLILLTLLAACIFLAALVVFYSLPFWISRSSRFPDQLFEVLIIASTIPQHVQPWGVKAVLFTIIPAGFISLLPASLAHHFDPLGFAALIGAAGVYALIALAVFNAGVRRYITAES